MFHFSALEDNNGKIVYHNIYSYKSYNTLFKTEKKIKEKHEDLQRAFGWEGFMWLFLAESSMSSCSVFFPVSGV